MFSFSVFNIIKTKYNIKFSGVIDKNHAESSERIPKIPEMLKSHIKKIENANLNFTVILFSKD